MRRPVPAPQLDFHPSEFNRALLARVPMLHAPYRPTPWLRNAHLQLAWLLLAEALAAPLRYDRSERLRMRDGGTTALCWLGLDRPADAPTLVVLHSITGDARSMRVVVRELHRLTGWRVALCLRRGHGDLELTAPVVNTMGCADDLREQLAHIREALPQSPLYAAGISAGSALLVRYLGEEGRRSLLRAGVAYCPGYDIGVAWDRVAPFYSRAMARRLQRYFLERHAGALRHLDGYQACAATRDLAAFQAHLHPLAGHATPQAYLARSNPVGVLDGIGVPVMILNAADDPVCVIQNALDHVGAIRRIPDALLVRTQQGSHCAFFEGWRPRSWSQRLIAQYLLAAHELLGAREGGARHGSPLSRG